MKCPRVGLEEDYQGPGGRGRSCHGPAARGRQKSKNGRPHPLGNGSHGQGRRVRTVLKVPGCGQRVSLTCIRRWGWSLKNPARGGSAKSGHFRGALELISHVI